MTQHVVLAGNPRPTEVKTQQSLKADLLKVWLDPPEEVKPKPDAKSKPDVQAASRQGKSQPASQAKSQQVKSQAASGSVTNFGRQAREVLGIGHVVARSKDINIHDTGKLIVKFIDVPAAKHLPPGKAVPEPKVDKRPAAVPVPSEPVKPRDPKAMPNGPQQPAPGPAQPASRQGQTGPVLNPPDNPPPPRPFDLSRPAARGPEGSSAARTCRRRSMSCGARAR